MKDIVKFIVRTHQLGPEGQSLGDFYKVIDVEADLSALQEALNAGDSYSCSTIVGCETVFHKKA